MTNFQYVQKLNFNIFFHSSNIQGFFFQINVKNSQTPSKFQNLNVKFWPGTDTKQKKQHATLHHLSTSKMLKCNRTIAWLKVKSVSEWQSVLDISRKHVKHLQQRQATRSTFENSCTGKDC